MYMILIMLIKGSQASQRKMIACNGSMILSMIVMSTKRRILAFFCINLPNTKEVKLLLKAEFERADTIGYISGRKFACEIKTVKKAKKEESFD